MAWPGGAGAVMQPLKADRRRMKNAGFMQPALRIAAPRARVERYDIFLFLRFRSSQPRSLRSL